MNRSLQVVSFTRHSPAACRFPFVLLFAALIAVAVLYATPADAADQQISTTPATMTASTGTPVRLDVRYDTSDGDASLTGLGLRVHFDNRKVTFSATQNAVSLGLMGRQGPQDDTGNEDGDTSTNRVLLMSWADIAGNWPGQVPKNLVTLVFNPVAGATGETRIRFTSSSTAAGYGLAATPTVISFGQAAGPGIGEAGPELFWVPSSAHVSGLAGTNWVTDVVVHNPSTAGTTANVFFLPTRQNNTSVRGQALQVAAGRSLKLADIVEDTFGLASGSGSLLVGSGQELLVTSRVYNDVSGGTYGQYMAGLGAPDQVIGTQEVRLIQLTNTADYRTNIGFTNATASQLSAEVKLYRADSAYLGSKTVTVPPYSHWQVTDILGAVGATSVPDAYAVVTASSASARYCVYASVVDNRTGDPVTVLPAPEVAAGSVMLSTGTAPIDVSSQTQATVLSDGFEGAFPGQWQLYETPDAADATWGKTSRRKKSGSSSVWCAAGGSAAGPAGGPYPDDMDTWMIFGPVSLVGATSATLEYDLWLDSEEDYDYFWWLVSDDCSSFYGGNESGSTGGWVHRSHDLGALTDVTLLGKPEVCIALNFDSDVTVGYEGAYVDNVVLTTGGGTCTPPAAPVVSAPASAASGASYTVSWTATSADGAYDIEEADNASFTNASRSAVAGTQKAFSHSVSSSATYHYRVRAKEACGGGTQVSPWSSGISTRVDPAGSDGESIYVAGGAALEGLAGTDWKTDLEVHNPSLFRAEFTIELLPRGQVGTSPQKRTYTLESGRSIRYTNALKNLFGFEGAATLRVTPTSGRVMVTSRTFNDQPGGTYGQFTPGVPESRAIPYGTSSRLVQLAGSSSGSTGFRSNIGLVNTTATNITVEIKVHAGDGGLLGTKTPSMRAYESIQLTDIFGQIGAGTVNDGYVVLRCTTAGGRFLAFASVIDNRSGDPVYMPAAVAGGS